jgi:hypothetical protein
MVVSWSERATTLAEPLQYSAMQSVDVSERWVQWGRRDGSMQCPLLQAVRMEKRMKRKKKRMKIKRKAV